MLATFVILFPIATAKPSLTLKEYASLNIFPTRNDESLLAVLVLSLICLAVVIWFVRRKEKQRAKEDGNIYRGVSIEEHQQKIKLSNRAVNIQQKKEAQQPAPPMQAANKLPVIQPKPEPQKANAVASPPLLDPKIQQINPQPQPQPKNDLWAFSKFKNHTGSTSVDLLQSPNSTAVGMNEKVGDKKEPKISETQNSSAGRLAGTRSSKKNNKINHGTSVKHRTPAR